MEGRERPVGRRFAIAPRLPVSGLGIGESVPVAAHFGSDATAVLSIRRDDHHYTGVAEIQLRDEDGFWVEPETYEARWDDHPFERPPTAPWRLLGRWLSGSGGDQRGCFAGMLEQQVARATVAIGGEVIDIPINAQTGAFVVVLRGRTAHDPHWRFYDAHANPIAERPPRAKQA